MDMKNGKKFSGAYGGKDMGKDSMKGGKRKPSSGVDPHAGDEMSPGQKKMKMEMDKRKNKKKM